MHRFMGESLEHSDNVNTHYRTFFRAFFTSSPVGEQNHAILRGKALHAAADPRHAAHTHLRSDARTDRAASHPRKAANAPLEVGGNGAAGSATAAAASRDRYGDQEEGSEGAASAGWSTLAIYIAPRRSLRPPRSSSSTT